MCVKGYLCMNIFIEHKKYITQEYEPKKGKRNDKTI